MEFKATVLKTRPEGEILPRVRIHPPPAISGILVPLLSGAFAFSGRRSFRTSCVVSSLPGVDSDIHFGFAYL